MSDPWIAMMRLVVCVVIVFGPFDATATRSVSPSSREFSPAIGTPIPTISIESLTHCQRAIWPLRPVATIGP